jgi:hypothetical protein
MKMYFREEKENVKQKSIFNGCCDICRSYDDDGICRACGAGY